MTLDPQKRYRDNPFIQDMTLKTKRQAVRVAPIGDNATIINPDTGESSGTHVVTYKKVDNANFIKLFTTNIKLTFGLSAAGSRALHVLMWQVQERGHNTTDITLDSHTLYDFFESNQVPDKERVTDRTFQRGLSELCKAGVLARAIRLGDFHLNPNFLFNGDRIAFTTLIERESDSDREAECRLR